MSEPKTVADFIAVLREELAGQGLDDSTPILFSRPYLDEYGNWQRDWEDDPDVCIFEQGDEAGKVCVIP